MGDATNMVIIFAGELLKKSENLLIMGLHPSEIIKGYELACIKALEELESAQLSFPPEFQKLIHVFRTLKPQPSIPSDPRFSCFGVEARDCL